MKKVISLVLVLVMVLAFTGCGKKTPQEIKITIPAGCTDDFVYSDTQVCPKKSFDVYGGIGIHTKSEFHVPEDRGIILNPDETGGKIYASNTTNEVLLTRKTWYNVGVEGNNPTDKDIEVSIILYDVDLRLE